jgi:hypothetical protein
MTKQSKRPATEGGIVKYKHRDIAQARAALLNQLDCNVMHFLKQCGVPVSFIKKNGLTSFSAVHCTKVIPKYQWHAGQGTVAVGAIEESQDSATMQQIAETAGTLLSDAWQSAGAKLESFEMEFGRNRQGKILLHEIDIGSWRIRYQRQPLTFDTASGMGLPEVLKSLRTAVELSGSFSPQIQP